MKWLAECLRLQTLHSRYFYNIPRLTAGFRWMSSFSKEFEDAKSRLNSLKSDPGNDAKLQLYALYKQVTTGKCNIKQPGVFDLVGRAKWAAWNALGDMSQEAASKEYISVVNKYAAAESGASTTSASSTKGYKTIQITNDGVIRTILLNRPAKKNAISLQMYEELIRALDEAGKDAGTVVTVITGAGDYYCSGNDLSSFMEVGASDKTPQQLAEEASVMLKRYVASFIDFPKLLIAVVNGPAVGISVTLLGLFDAVLATERATFHTPFSSLGQSPEGCSSLIFPTLMGFGKANEMLLFNRKLSAQAALERNIVTQVFPDEKFQTEAWKVVKEIASFPPNSMLLSKRLMRERMRKQLHDVNEQECNLLVKRWQSDECMNAILSFMQRRAKL